MKDFRPVVMFLAKFVVVLSLLTVGYNLYLHQFHKNGKPDPVSHFITDCTVSAMNVAGMDAYQKDDQERPWIWMGADGKWLSYFNEGCNAISIIIIFSAFIIAFSTTWLKTLLYILFGTVIIQVMNVFRITLLNYILLHHEEYGEMAHDYLFPAIIYGTIVVLWILWIRFFVIKKRSETDEEVA